MTEAMQRLLDPDAPDYTLLSDVNVVGSVTINVNVVGSVALNVNIIGSTVTLDVNVTNATINISIQSQTIDLKIYTPSGRWTTISQTVATTTYVESAAAQPGQEVTIFSIIGRGRLMNMGIYFFYISGPPSDLYHLAVINVYVDGTLKMTLTPERLDGMTGCLEYMLRLALSHALLTGISIPYNTNRTGTNPDLYLIRPENVNPRGALTWAIWNQTGSYYEKIGGFVNVDEEFFNKLEVKLKNNENTAVLAVGVVAMVGAYP